jgi:alpha-N-arabinofuranosidase
MTKAAVFCLAAGLASAQTVRLTVNTGALLRTVDPKIYGQFLEPANGGVWGEVVSNRSFEETLAEGEWKVNGGVLEAAGDARLRFGAEAWRDCELTVDVMRPSGNGVISVGATVSEQMENGRWYNVRRRISGLALLGVTGGPASFAHIRVTAADGTLLFAGLPTPAREWFAAGAGEIAWNSDAALNGERSLRIVARDADSGIEQPGYAVRAGDALRGSLWLAGTGPGLVVRLLDGDKILAEQAVGAPGAEWREFPLLLSPTATSANATLRILARAGSVVKLDHVSLMADSSRANGGFRPDLTQAVVALRPPMIGWPGSGWKNTIGPQATRAFAFGIDEFLAFARKVGAQPMIVSPGADSAELAEYCNGSPESAWGKIRAQNGHKEPYRVKFSGESISEWNVPGAEWSGGLDAARLLSAMERNAAAHAAAPRLLLRHVMAGGQGNALIEFDQRTWFPSASHAVMKLYRDHFAPDLLGVTGQLEGLSASATRSADGDKIYVKLVNPLDREVAVEVALAGDFPLLDASIQTIAPDDLAARAVKAVPGEVTRAGLGARVRLPRWSVAVLTLTR